MTETKGKNSKNYQRIIQFKVDDSKIKRDRFEGMQRSIDDRVGAINSAINEKFSSINEKIDKCASMCENLLDIVNAMAEVLDDHKRQIEELGK